MVSITCERDENGADLTLCTQKLFREIRQVLKRGTGNRNRGMGDRGMVARNH